MGNSTCQALVASYIISSDPYYKIHLLITLVVYVLSYIYYLKDENFDDYENKFVVFLSKFILLPIALNYIIAMAVGVVIGYMRKPLIDLAIKKCPLAEDPAYITNVHLRTAKAAATKELQAKMKGKGPPPSDTPPKPETFNSQTSSESS
jgi:hypothetical protein